MYKIYVFLISLYVYMLQNHFRAHRFVPVIFFAKKRSKKRFWKVGGKSPKNK